MRIGGEHQKFTSVPYRFVRKNNYSPPDISETYPIEVKCSEMFVTVIAADSIADLRRELDVNGMANYSITIGGRVISEGAISEYTGVIELKKI